MVKLELAYHELNRREMLSCIGLSNVYLCKLYAGLSTVYFDYSHIWIFKKFVYKRLSVLSLNMTELMKRFSSIGLNYSLQDRQII